MKAERRKRRSRRERELISTILDSIPAMVTFFDAAGKVRFVNRFFEQRTGWSRDLLGERDLVDLCFPDPVVRKEAVSFMLSGLTGWKNFPLQAADESVIHSSWSNVRLSDGSYVGIGIDTTKELLMEERIRSLAIQLSRAAEVEQQSLAGAIHDHLVQPLASMKLSLEGLKSENDVPGSAVSRLEDVLISMSGLIQEMRRISDELYPPVLTHLRIDEVLHWLAEQLGEQYEFRINVETEGNFSPLDPDKKYFIYTAVRELVHNISKHADAKLVWLAMSAEPGEIMITVQDDGLGFDQALLENLLHREGGFGLFHIQMRLEQFGGVLAIRSDPGKGTAISIKIPVDENPKGFVP